MKVRWFSAAAKNWFHCKTKYHCLRVTLRIYFLPLQRSEIVSFRNRRIEIGGRETVWPVGNWKGLGDTDNIIQEVVQFPGFFSLTATSMKSSPFDWSHIAHPNCSPDVRRLLYVPTSSQ